MVPNAVYRHCNLTQYLVDLEIRRERLSEKRKEGRKKKTEL